jgi:hypothetical protein
VNDEPTTVAPFPDFRVTRAIGWLAETVIVLPMPPSTFPPGTGEVHEAPDTVKTFEASP